MTAPDALTRLVAASSTVADLHRRRQLWLPKRCSPSPVVRKAAERELLTIDGLMDRARAALERVRRERR